MKTKLILGFIGMISLNAFAGPVPGTSARYDSNSVNCHFISSGNPTQVKLQSVFTISAVYPDGSFAVHSTYSTYASNGQVESPVTETDQTFPATPFFNDPVANCRGSISRIYNPATGVVDACTLASDGLSLTYAKGYYLPIQYNPDAHFSSVRCDDSFKFSLTSIWAP